MSRFTTDKLVSDIRRRGSIPETPQTPSDDELIAFMNDAQDLALIPAVLAAKEEFFVANKDYTIGSEREFILPERTLGQRLRMVQILDANGHVISHLPRFQPEIGQSFNSNSINGFLAVNRVGYMFEANKVILLGSGDQAGPTLRLKYYKRPGYLVNLVEAGQIVSIDPMTGEIQLDKAVSSFVPGAIVDVIAQTSPFDTTAEDIAIVTAAGFAIEISPATAATLAVGDWVCLAGETVIPQWPRELHPLFIQYTLMKVLDSLNRGQMSQAMAKDFELLMGNLSLYIDDRDDGSPQVIRTEDGLFDYFDDAWYNR